MKKTRFAAKMLADLGKLAQVTDVTLSALADKLCALPVELYPFEAVSNVLKAEFFANSDEKADLAASAPAVSGLLFGISSSGETVSELMQTVNEQLQATVSTEDAQKVLRFLERIVGSSALLTSFKATSLFEENEHLLLDSKTIVDVRPIFDPRERMQITASALLFKLRLTYRSPANSELDAIVLTLGDEELEQLCVSAVRAKEKAATLREKMSTAGMPVIPESST